MAKNENESRWSHFLVHYNKDKEFHDFLAKNKIQEADRTECKDYHRHYLCVIPEELDLKAEPLCKRRMTKEDMALFCDQKVFPNYEINYVAV
jgi:hypothetical protein